MWRHVYTSLDEIKGLTLQHLPKTPSLAPYTPGLTDFPLPEESLPSS
jgi:hypothetical protein